MVILQACPFLVSIDPTHPEDARDTSKRFELFMFSCFTQPPAQLNYDASQRDETRDDHINYKAADSQITFKTKHNSNAQNAQNTDIRMTQWRWYWNTTLSSL